MITSPVRPGSLFSQECLRDSTIPGKETHDHGPLCQLWAAPSFLFWEMDLLFLLELPGKVGGLSGVGTMGLCGFIVDGGCEMASQNLKTGEMAATG